MIIARFELDRCTGNSFIALVPEAETGSCITGIEPGIENYSGRQGEIDQIPHPFL